jgi:hypothetical protein
MRTTLTLDPDVAQELKTRTADGKASFKEVVNDALRRGLAATPKTKPAEIFRVEATRLGLKPGIDPYKLNHLADQLEDQELIRKMRRFRKLR